MKKLFGSILMSFILMFSFSMSASAAESSELTSLKDYHVYYYEVPTNAKTMKVQLTGPKFNKNHLYKVSVYNDYNSRTDTGIVAISKNAGSTTHELPVVKGVPGKGQVRAGTTVAVRVGASDFNPNATDFTYNLNAFFN
ncbi:hypothetical protein [Bacillus sp. GC_Bacil_1]|nr:hypothetical protein [Bacillus sp. GC_Bacil_1]